MVNVIPKVFEMVSLVVLAVFISVKMCVSIVWVFKESMIAEDLETGLVVRGLVFKVIVV